MTKIFISYRRSDDPYAARSINDALCSKFGESEIYFDLDALQAGLDFRAQIDAMVAECDVMLVVIGDDWLQVDDSGRSRLENEDDLVLLEVSSALKRDIPVIPVLVGKAIVPSKDLLPEEIESLVYRQAVEVRATASFSAQLDKLLRSIKAVAPGEVATEDVEPSKPPPWKLLIGLFFVLATIVVSVYWYRALKPSLEVIDPPLYALTINTEPADAKIRFLSTGQEYQPGVLLVSGSYHVEVSREGFVTQTRWLEIENTDLSLDFVLESEKLFDRQVFKDCDVCPEMVVIPAGNFVMGSSFHPSEQPQHQVSISSFAMGKYEVTFDEYDAFARSTGGSLPDDEGWGRGTRPVIYVSWDDAQAYVEWLSSRIGARYRLPSEAEWEYAARGREITKYWWGDEINQDGKVWANCGRCGNPRGNEMTHKVGEFSANPFGLHDTSGNVWEWVEDCLHSHYMNAPDDGSAWLEVDGGNCDQRVFRGGSWGYEPLSLRSATRSLDDRSLAANVVGFRLARDLWD